MLFAIMSPFSLLLFFPALPSLLEELGVGRLAPPQLSPETS